MAFEPTSTGQVTITAVPSKWPWTSSPQVPGAQAAPRPTRFAVWHESSGVFTAPKPIAR